MRIVPLLVIAVVLPGCKPEPKCDEGAAAREAWITAPDPNDPDGFSPAAKGFRSADQCATKISDKMLDCSMRAAQSVHGEGRLLRRALELGFAAYVCELAGTGQRTEYQLASVVQQPARGYSGRPPAEPEPRRWWCTSTLCSREREMCEELERDMTRDPSKRERCDGYPVAFCFVLDGSNGGASCVPTRKTCERMSEGMPGRCAEVR